jgi:hypothetical protein
MTDYRTCTHTHDNGNTCHSAALKDRDYCRYHLRYRGRLMRAARYRSRNQLLHFQMPPLEDMFAVQSALTQLAEALAADMIDPKRAQALLSVLRQASKNLQTAGKWATNIYHSDCAAPYDNFESEFDLPANLDLSLSPEVAFPPQPESAFSDLSSRATDAPSAGATDERGLSAQRSGLSPAVGKWAGFDGTPTSPDFPTTDGQPSPDSVAFRPDFPLTPEMVEVLEVAETHGSAAAALRGSQLERNRQRRQLRATRKRYAETALRHNIRVAAEKLAAKQLAADKLEAERIAPSAESSTPPAKKPAASAVIDASRDRESSEKNVLSPTG